MFKKGDKVVSVKTLKPYEKYGMMPFLREAMFDGVKTVEKVSNGGICWVNGAWYPPEALKHAEDATENDFIKVRYCEECHSCFMVDIGKTNILQGMVNNLTGRNIELPEVETYFCLRCNHIEMPMQDIKKITKAIMGEK